MTSEGFYFARSANFYFWLSLTMLALVCSCGTSHSAPQSITSSQIEPRGKGQNSNASIKPPEETLSGFFHGNPKGEESWKRFIEGSKYRLARASDFNYSTAAKKTISDRIGPEWEKRIVESSTGGEINHDKFYRDHAHIVLDTTRSDANRFGLIIFNDQESDETNNGHWLYREKDLSTTIFGWSSDGLYLEKYNEDGSYDKCYIKWNLRRKMYTCDKR